MLYLIVFVWAVGFLEESSGFTNVSPYAFIALAFYFIILAVWVIAASFKMRRDATLRKCAITALVLGILTLNILTIIGGAIGLSKSNKMKTGRVYQNVQ
jgi:hypothetical protein